MSFLKSVRQLAHPYYIINIILSLSYLTIKKFPYICHYVPLNPDSVCELDSRESEILFFLIIVVMLRTRRAGSVTMVSYLSSSFMYAKIANMLLWFYADVRLGLAFCIAFVLTGLFFPEPTYSGPQKITYFKSLDSFGEEMERDKSVSWVVAFYTMWSPACNNFAPIFAQISADYHTTGLRFGKLDIGRSPEAAKKYNINDAPTSKQLPTVILFQNGKEVCRRPFADSSGRLQKFFFSESLIFRDFQERFSREDMNLKYKNKQSLQIIGDNMRTTFDLNNLYEQSKNRVKSMKKIAANSKKEQ